MANGQQGLLGSTAITTPAAASPAPPRTGLAPSPAAATEEQPNVSPEEQDEYDMVVNNAYSLLYEDMPTLLKSISGGGDPVTGLANTVANTMSRLVNSAAKTGKKFSEGVVLNAGIEVLEDLADLALDSGIHDFTPEELESATYLAAETYRDIQQNAGNIDSNEAAGDLEALQQAEASGELEGVLPGVAERFSEFKQGPQSIGQAGDQPRTGLAQ